MGDDILFEDHLHKCRCCFRILIDEDKAVELNEQIRMRFYELTQISLIQDKNYSSVICELCDRDLKKFFHLKRDISSKQKRLYELKTIATELKEIEYTIEALDDTLIDEDDGRGVNYKDESQQFLSRKKEQRQKITEKDAKPKNGPFKCECGLVLANKSSFQRHVERIHHKVKNFHCDLCSYSAFFKHSLEKHVLKHVPEKFREKFSCELCEFVSISSVNIRLHKKFEHDGVDEKFPCVVEKCGKIFSRPTQLSAHVRLTHEKIRKKTCSVCEKSFSTSTRLKEHLISSHSKAPRQYVCEQCAKLFTTLRQLKNHQVYHEDPKFQCQMGCDKKFFKEVLLRGHHKTHSAQKDFICSETNCGQKYFLKSHLIRHVQSAHEKIKISCEICSSKFVRKETYKRHVLMQHPGLEIKSRWK